MQNEPLDKMTYYCNHCNHIWRFLCNKIGTDKQVYDWFESVQQEHYMFCDVYRQLMQGDLDD